MKRPLIIGGALAAVAYTQYRDFELFRDNLTFAVRKIKILTSQTNQQQIAFQAELSINNPRDYKITAQGMVIVIAKDGKPILSINRNTPFEIKPDAITNVLVTIPIPYTSAVPAVIALFTEFFNDFRINLELAGKIRFQLLDINFSTNFKLIG